MFREREREMECEDKERQNGGLTVKKKAEKGERK